MNYQTFEHQVARNFLALGSGEALARLIGFAATVYIARTLGATSYGIVGFSFAVYLYLARIADCGMEHGLGIREIAADPRNIDWLAPSLMGVRMLSSLMLVLAVVTLSILIIPEPDGSVLATTGLLLLATGGNTRWIHLGLERTRFASLARAGGQVVMVVLVVSLVRGPGDLARVPLAQFIGDMLAGLMLAGWLSRRGHAIAIRIDWARVAPLLRRAASLVGSGLLGLVVYNSDLLFLRVFWGATDVGYYAAAYVLVSFLINLGTAYHQSLLPTLTRLAPQPRDEYRLYHTAMAHVFAVTLPIAIGGYFLAPHIIAFVFGTAYGASAPALQLLVWSVPFLLARGVSKVALMARQREHQVLRSEMWATAINIGLNVFLIPRYGIMGAALSTVFTEAARWGILLALARREGFRETSVSRFWRSGVAGLMMAGLMIIFPPTNIWLGMLMGAVAYIAILTIVRGIRFRRGALPQLTV